MKLPWIIVIVLAIALALMFIFRPQPQDKQIQRLQHENDSLLIRISQHQANAVKLAELRKSDSLETIKTKKAYTLKVEKLEGRISDLKANPVIIRIREEVKEVDSLIVVYDSTIQVKDERIRELESELTTSQQLASQAELNFKATIGDYEQVHKNLLEQVEHYKKELRKQRRQKRAAIVLGGLIGIAGLLL
jgi:hypothetical protein